MLQTKRADFNALARKFSISPVTARIIRNRDVADEKEIERYLYGTVRDLYDPRLLKDMDRAVFLLKEAIDQGRRIRIVGDYDIDGVCSTYLLYQGIKRCGGRVDYQIPERIRDGYGINENIIRKASEDGIDMIITCDNGIAAVEQIRLAKELGMTVVVTDHHEVFRDEQGTELLPPADAVVNPKQESCSYPFKGICGAMVAYKVICGLYERMGFGASDLEELMEFAAIATAGDVMDLQDENRIMVKEGLKRIAHTQNLGLKALIHVNNLEDRPLTAYHIGFVIGPCMNASGRLSTAKRALNLLLCRDREEAAALAADLKALNDSRKDMTAKGVEEAAEMVENTSLHEDRVLVIYLPKCHESLAGIIAGRIRERYNKPVFVLTKAEEGVKGSGRSIETYHMFRELTKCRELLSKFGGHPMAAGLSLPEENVKPFRQMLNENCTLTEEDMAQKVLIDVPMPISYVNMPLIRQLSLLEPFGKGNTKPLFAQKNVRIENCRVFGKNRNVVKMKLFDENGCEAQGVWFGEGDAFVERIKEKPR